MLRSLSTGMASTEAFGEEGSSADLLFPALGSSLREVTLPMWSIIGRRHLQRCFKSLPQAEIIAFHLSVDPLWMERPAVFPEERPLPSVREIIFVQEEGKGVVDRDMEAGVTRSISHLLSKSTFPSLERVLYVTETDRGSIWQG